jgi:Flp pilus assembly protein TadD
MGKGNAMKTTHAFSLRSMAFALAAPIAAAALLGGCASHRYVTPEPVATTRAPDTGAELRIAERALEAGDTQLAVDVFEKLLKADPKSTTAQIGLGDAMYQSGDLARAGVLYANAASAAAGDPRAELGLARVALRERRLDEAVTRYRKLATAQPENVLAAEGLGAALDLQGKHGEAQTVYRTALERHPEVQGLKTDLGLSLTLSNKAREGANVLLDIAGLPDAPAQARANLALAYGLLGNSEAAKRILVADMPVGSVEDNLQFYRQLRERLAAPINDGAANVKALPDHRVSSSGTVQ